MLTDRRAIDATVNTAKRVNSDLPGCYYNRRVQQLFCCTRQKVNKHFLQQLVYTKVCYCSCRCGCALHRGCFKASGFSGWPRAIQMSLLLSTFSNLTKKNMRK